jgi:hypothetical protein
MDRQHPVHELLGRLARPFGFVEVGDVLPAPGDELIEVVVRRAGGLVARNDDPRCQGLDLVDAGHPGEPGLVVGLGQPHVDPVVGHVAADHGVEVGDVHDGRRCGVALADIDETELVALQVDDVAVECLG